MRVGFRLVLLLMLGSVCVCNLNAQGFTVTTVAGNGFAAFSGDNGPATAASLNNPRGVAVDAAGNIYIADSLNHRVRKVSIAGVITTVAGTGTPGYSGDGDVATAAELNSPSDVAIDPSGLFLYVADQGNNRIRRIFQGLITTAAGNGSATFGNDGPALTVSIGSPVGVAVDASRNVYFTALGEHRVRRLAESNGLVTTFAGTGNAGFSGDGGGASSAQVNSPSHLAVDAGGNLYIADTNNFRIRKVFSTGIIQTVAGVGSGGVGGDGGSALSAGIGSPWAVTVDSQGNIYLTSTNHPNVRKVATSGFISTVAGNGSIGFTGDGGLAVLAQFGTGMAITAGSTGNIFLADVLSQGIRKLDVATAARIGGFAHIASGGNWRTTLVLINLSTTNIDAQVRFFANDGSPLTLPLTFPLSSTSSVASSASATIGPSASYVIETAASTASTAVGWADVQAAGPLSGYSIFRFSTTNSEGTVSMDNGASSLVLPFDNRNGGRTGFALANMGSATTVNVTVLDQNGGLLGSGQINLNASGHDSRFLDELLPLVANRVGIVRLSTTNSLITSIGFRFSPTGSFTSIPIAR